ncbi:MAG: DUF1786 family protein [Candidatus Hydrothermarchaeota archaeon]|nr:DUF1786 family protein [Candidatus Hydrothermarchaeota archaeon]
MRILAIDVGMGTQDILVYDDSGVPDNSIKMVFPSMTQILAKRVARCKGDLCFYGSTMGGGPLAYAIKNHMRKGFKVAMTPEAARSLRDNLEQVREMGVEIIADDEVGESRGRLIETRDVDFPFIKRVLTEIGECSDFDVIGVAVQDHGYAMNKSDREFRFEKFREALEKDGKLYSLGFYNPPAHYTRMSSLAGVIKEQPERAFIVDSKIAAIVGALYGIKERPVITIDIGNGHTLEDYLRRFAAGELTNEEVFSDGGHGCYSKEELPIRKIKKILATGPMRGLLANSDLQVSNASPMGDVMMAGPIGIVNMIKSSGHF